MSSGCGVCDWYRESVFCFKAVQSGFPQRFSGSVKHIGLFLIMNTVWHILRFNRYAVMLSVDCARLSFMAGFYKVGGIDLSAGEGRSDIDLSSGFRISQNNLIFFFLIQNKMMVNTVS